MASKTTNYGLHKFDLTDSPPDITAINDSMDKIDTELKKRVENTKVLPVENGGTGANTKKEAFDNLAFLGNNPISSTDEDIPQKWCELGSGYAWFNTLNMIDQPYVFMFVLNYVHEADIFQIGSGQGGMSTVYYRTGNGRSWYMNWTPLFGANSAVPIANGGTGTRDAQSAFINLGQRAFMGADTDINSPNQAGCYNSNGWRQTGGAKDLPTNSYGIFENKKAGGSIKQTYACTNKYGDYGLYVRFGEESNIAENEWQRVYTSRNAASLIQNLLKEGSISMVKSVQHKSGIMPGDVTTLDITISSVNSSKSFISFSANGNGTSAGFIPVGVFKNNTTITLTRIDSGSSSWTCSYAFDVVEFY